MGEGGERSLKGVSAPSGLRHSVRAFRHRNYVLFWCGALASNTGSWLSNLTVPYVLYQMTGSALWVGMVSVWQFLPGLFLGPVGGAFADRHERRRVVFLTQTGMAAAAFLMWAAWQWGPREPLVLLALVGLSGIFQGLNLPSWQSLVSDLVPRDDLRSAVSLNSLQFNAARAIGPAVAGAVLAAFGPAWAFFLNGVSFFFVLAALSLIRGLGDAGPAAAPSSGITRQFTEAVRYIRGRPGILVSLLVSVLIGVLGNPVFQLTVVFAESVFHTGAVGLGLLNAALGVGAVLAAPLVSGGFRGLSLSRTVRWGLVVYGMALMAFALAPGYPFALFSLVVVGGCFLAVVSGVNTSVQLMVADRLRGRVMACRIMVTTASFPVGGLLQGHLTDLLGPRAALCGVGAVMLLSALLLVRGFGRLRLDRLDDPHDTETPREHLADGPDQKNPPLQGKIH